MSVVRPVVADVAVPASVDTPRTERELAEPRWWRTALVALIGAAGLLVVSEALLYSRSHTGSGEAQFWFWVGLLAIVLPCTALLAGRTATRTERVVAVVVLAVLLYLVKVVHDPFTFTYSDEWVHAFNAKQVLGTGALYHSNPIVPVSARYPGLEAATSAIATMTGLSVFVSGLILVGAARLVGALALFHLLERLTSSERIAGIGVLVYAANPNFLFWGVQYSYESLALPLVFLTLLAASAATGPPRAAADSGTGTLADVVAGERPERLGWALAALLSISAVVVTHHVSAFILSGSLILVCLVAQVSRAGRTQAPWLLAAYSTAATLAWLFVVAPQTVGYLTPVLAGAFHQTVGALLGHVHGRAPFSNGGGAGSSGGLPATVAPFWQRAVTIASIGLITVSVVVGLFELRRRRTRNAYAIALGLAGLAYVAVLPMRLVPAAWETSNRASEFLFAGVALLVALAATRIWSRPRLFAVGATCAVAVIFVGGVVAGWPPRVLLALPYRVDSGGHDLVPQSATLGRITPRALGTANRLVAPEADGRVLLVEGGQTAYITSASFDPKDVLFAPTITPTITSTLAQQRIRYVAIDRLLLGDDSMAGYFFPPRAATGVPKDVVTKYDNRPGVDRRVDTGNIVVYDVGRLTSGAH